MNNEEIIMNNTNAPSNPLFTIHYSFFNIKLAPAISRGAFGGSGGTAYAYSSFESLLDSAATKKRPSQSDLNVFLLAEAVGFEPTVP